MDQMAGLDDADGGCGDVGGAADGDSGEAHCWSVGRDPVGCGGE